MRKLRLLACAAMVLGAVAGASADVILDPNYPSGCSDCRFVTGSSYPESFLQQDEGTCASSGDPYKDPGYWNPFTFSMLGLGVAGMVWFRRKGAQSALKPLS